MCGRTPTSPSRETRHFSLPPCSTMPCPRKCWWKFWGRDVSPRIKGRNAGQEAVSNTTIQNAVRRQVPRLIRGPQMLDQRPRWRNSRRRRGVQEKSRGTGETGKRQKAGSCLEGCKSFRYKQRCGWFHNVWFVISRLKSRSSFVSYLASFHTCHCGSHARQRGWICLQSRSGVISTLLVALQWRFRARERDDCFISWGEKSIVWGENKLLVNPDSWQQVWAGLIVVNREPTRRLYDFN